MPQEMPKADDVVKQARIKAATENKSIFLIFGASWCEPCHQMNSFLAARDIAPIFGKYFVVARIAVGEVAGGHSEHDNPGSDSLMMRYGGVISSGEASLPFIVLLDSKAKLIVNSKRPLKGNSVAGIGFPTEPEEITWFLTMLRKAAPAILPAEIHTVQEGLRKFAVQRHEPKTLMFAKLESCRWLTH